MMDYVLDFFFDPGIFPSLFLDDIKTSFFYP